jgi:hypothetical protein
MPIVKQLRICRLIAVAALDSRFSKNYQSFLSGHFAGLEYMRSNSYGSLVCNQISYSLINN